MVAAGPSDVGGPVRQWVYLCLLFAVTEKSEMRVAGPLRQRRLHEGGFSGRRSSEMRWTSSVRGLQLSPVKRINKIGAVGPQRFDRLFGYGRRGARVSLVRRGLDGSSVAKSESPAQGVVMTMTL